MDSMKARLETAGMTMGDLVMVQVHCSDLSLYKQCQAQRATPRAVRRMASRIRSRISGL
jgi:hypothetical protein